MPARRVLISIDERILSRLDADASRRGLTRSAYIAQMATERLGGGQGPGARPESLAAVQAIEDLLVDAPAFESTDVVRRLRHGL
jgi:hypothetical protein